MDSIVGVQDEGMAWPTEYGAKARGSNGVVMGWVRE